MEAPEGIDFLELLRRQEDMCAATTPDRLPQMGQRAPECLAALGTVLFAAGPGVLLLVVLPE